MERVPELPPTSEPSVVPENEKPRPRVAVVVPTLPSWLAEVKYGMLPTTAALDVLSPFQPSVEPVRENGKVAVRAFCLLLNVLQSVEERRPRGLVAEACGMFRV